MFLFSRPFTWSRISGGRCNPSRWGAATKTPSSIGTAIPSSSIAIGKLCTPRDCPAKDYYGERFYHVERLQTYGERFSHAERLFQVFVLRNISFRYFWLKYFMQNVRSMEYVPETHTCILWVLCFKELTFPFALEILPNSTSSRFSLFQTFQQQPLPPVKNAASIENEYVCRRTIASMENDCTLLENDSHMQNDLDYHWKLPLLGNRAKITFQNQNSSSFSMQEIAPIHIIDPESWISTTLRYSNPKCNQKVSPLK